MKKTVYLLTLLALFFWTAAVSAATMDLLPLFDTNHNGKIQFGDNSGGDFLEAEVVTKTFDLVSVPASEGYFTLTITFDNVQSGAYFNFNGTDYTPFGNFSGTKTFTDDVAGLFGTGNNLTFYVFPYSGSNQDDYLLYKLSLEYDAAAPGNSPVPEPGTLVLFGLGILGLAGAGRKQMTMN